MNNQILFQGDCLELMQQIPDKSVDMILCDLPYGTTACKWDVIIPFEALWKQYERIIKDNGAIVLFGSQPFTSVLVMSNIKMYKYDWIWYKNTQTGIGFAKKQPMRSYETISVFYKTKCNYFPQPTKSRAENMESLEGKPRSRKGKSDHTSMEFKDGVYSSNVNPRNVLEFKTVHNTHNQHPTQKPVALLEYLIKTYTNPNELVLDNTMGSGSTGVACVNTLRDFIGIEKDEKYFAIAEDRIAKAVKDLESKALEVVA